MLHLHVHTMMIISLIITVAYSLTPPTTAASFEIQPRTNLGLELVRRSTSEPAARNQLWRRVMEYAVGKQISADLTNYKNILFNCKVSFGNGQVFNMDLDTGSADTWVRGAGCKSNDGSCTGGGALQLDTAMIPLKAAFQTMYAIGGVQGNIYQSPVQIGPFQGVVPLGVATALEGFKGERTDGLIGLAFDSISRISRSTGLNANFMDALFGNSSNNMVSFYLPAAVTSIGQVTFGGMNETKFTGPMTFLPLSSPTYWQFTLTGSTFTVGGITGDFAGVFKDAIVDTGITLMIIDQAVANVLNKAIGATLTDRAMPGLGVFASCATALQGPPLSFTVGGAVYTIPASVYVLQDQNLRKCFSGISGTTAQEDRVATLGDTWIRAVYTTFDKSRARIGFAQSKHT